MTNDLLYQKLMDFSLDNPEASFSFSDRLARENGWTKKYALRVINEYKRFIYLSVVTKKSLTPSDEVDQAWHLHMIYTHSYWVEMCGELLNDFRLHHGPTKGGSSEGERYNLQYSDTLDIYEKEFGSAPSDIWPSVDKRFNKFNFRRVSVDDNIILNKSSVFNYLASFIAVILAILLLSNTQKDDSNGKDILIFVLCVVLAIFIIRGIIRYINRNNRGGGSSSSGSSSSCSTSSGCTILGSFIGCGSSGCGSSGCGSSGCGSSGCGGCGGCGS